MPFFHLTLIALPSVFYCLLSLLHILEFFFGVLLYLLKLRLCSFYLLRIYKRVLCRCSALFDYSVEHVSLEHGNVNWACYVCSCLVIALFHSLCDRLHPLSWQLCVPVFVLTEPEVSDWNRPKYFLSFCSPAVRWFCERKIWKLLKWKCRLLFIL
jgi:hypothetical protein